MDIFIKEGIPKETGQKIIKLIKGLKIKVQPAIQTKENIKKLVDMEANLKELCARIVPDLDNCNNQDKKDAYTYLDLKIKATPEGADIKGYLDSSVFSSDSCLLIAGQTSGCLSSDEYKYLIPFNFSIKWESPLTGL